MAGPVKVLPTAGAQRAFGVAQLVNKVFAETRVKGTSPGHAGFKVEMSGPAGPSTADSMRALQYIRLVALDGAGAIEIATCDPNAGVVELRSFDHLRSVDGDTTVDRADYEALIAKVEQFFERQGIETKVVAARIPTPPPRVSAAPPAAPEPQPGSTGLIGLVLVALVIAVLVFVFVGR
jgi:hypothetical protein